MKVPYENLNVKSNPRKGSEVSRGGVHFGEKKRKGECVNRRERSSNEAFRYWPSFRKKKQERGQILGAKS